MNRRNIFLLALFLAHVVIGSAYGQQDDHDKDPFFANEALTSSPKPAKKQKVVIHIPTFELCIEWLDQNLQIAMVQDRAVETRRQIESLRQQTEVDNERIQQLEKELEAMRSGQKKWLEQLNRIPYDTTFDLERWERFNAELKHRRQHFRTVRAKERAIAQYGDLEIRDLKEKNRALAEENKALRETIQRLKDAGNH